MRLLRIGISDSPLDAIIIPLAWPKKMSRAGSHVYELQEPVDEKIPRCLTGKFENQRPPF